MSWREEVEHTTHPDNVRRLLGEDEHGFLWVPTKGGTRSWRRFSPWLPRHWLFYLNSRETRLMTYLERES